MGYLHGTNDAIKVTLFDVINTCASSHLNSNVNNLSTILNSCLYPSVRVGDDKLYLSQTSVIAFFPIFNGLYIFIICDSSYDLYPVTKPSSLPSDLMSLGPSTWHQCLGHPGDDVEFDMTDLGALNHFLRISITRDTTGMFLSQKRYAIELLERAHMLNCNPTRTPVDTESKLGPEGTPISDPTFCSQKDSSLCLDTLEFGLHLYASSESSLVAYLDADWVGCPATRRSTSRYCVFFGNNILSWSSKRQPTLSRSSAEAEYRSVANVVAEMTWLCNLLRELHIPLLTATLVYCDNVSAVYLSVNPVQHQRIKHIEIDIHFVRDMVAMGHVRVLHVPSRYQYADIFTKGLPSALFEEFHTIFSVRLPPAQTAGE
ncbi:ribonuclease H-like domain-containing protein, partial [Tanacetum coccineum]